ncbi:MAG: hypothetical protein OXG62_09050 [Nitrospinae bacterium]|nr:hypothetical protein [Nitrospinota bacterium]
MTSVQGSKTGDKIQKQIAINILNYRPLRTFDNDSFGAHTEAEGSAALRFPETFKLLAGFGAGMGNHKFRRFQCKPSLLFTNISTIF